MKGKVDCYFILFVATIVLTVSGASGFKCYSCTSTPSKYDADCYYGRTNVSYTTCNEPEFNACQTESVNNLDGTFNVSRKCHPVPTSNKDVPWNTYVLVCATDFCNVHNPHIPPEIQCYSCTSTPSKYDDDCYYGRANVTSTIKCEGYCSTRASPNLDGSMNVTRDCYRYSPTPVPKYCDDCSSSFCNNHTSHIAQNCGISCNKCLYVNPTVPTTTSLPTSPNSASIRTSFFSSGKQHAWIFLGTTLSFYYVAKV